MGGFLNVGQSGTEKAALNNTNNIFSTGLGLGTTAQSSGTSTLGQAGNAFTNLLNATVPGRSQLSQLAAPATNAVTAGEDARKRQEASSGTGRSGGTVEANRNADATADASRDNIIANQLGLQQKLQTEKQLAGASGLESVGSAQLSDAAALLGLSSGASEAELSAATGKENAQSQAFSNIIAGLL